jgi:hypothetical protein
MATKTALRQHLDDAHRRLRAAARTADTPIAENWTVKEVVAHVAVWDAISAAALRALARGETPAVDAVDIEAISARAVAACATRSDEEVMAQWEQARADLVALLDDVPVALLEESFRFPWGPRGTVAEMVVVLAQHELEHAVELEYMQADT